MKDQLKTLDDLAPAPYNPRSITERAADGLRASLDRFGDIAGIVWNKRTGRLVTGHQRVNQLRALGATLEVDPDSGQVEIDVGGRSFSVRVVDWNEDEEKAANITANNKHIGGDFTEELDALLEDLQQTLGDDSFSAIKLDSLLKDALPSDGSVPDMSDFEKPDFDSGPDECSKNAPNEAWFYVELYEDIFAYQALLDELTGAGCMKKNSRHELVGAVFQQMVELWLRENGRDDTTSSAQSAHAEDATSDAEMEGSVPLRE